MLKLAPMGPWPAQSQAAPSAWRYVSQHFLGARMRQTRDVFQWLSDPLKTIDSEEPCACFLSPPSLAAMQPPCLPRQLSQQFITPPVGFRFLSPIPGLRRALSSQSPEPGSVPPIFNKPRTIRCL